MIRAQNFVHKLWQDLTPREMVVCTYIMDGRDKKWIASHFEVSMGCINSHVYKIKKKARKIR